MLRGGCDERVGVSVMIDWSRVDELRSEIGAEDFGDVVALFFEEADEVAARLAAAADRGGIEGELHFLKGSALNLGLAELAALCQAGERAARGGQGAAVDLAAILACYRASKAAFLAGSRRSAA
jgi:HPt (histidine-containing phosphotransfer) domain-containing protein